jgi:hypothetical protein
MIGNVFQCALAKVTLLLARLKKMSLALLSTYSIQSLLALIRCWWTSIMGCFLEHGGSPYKYSRKKSIVQKVNLVK